MLLDILTVSRLVAVWFPPSSALGMIWEYVSLQSDLQSAYVRDTLSFRNRIRDGINEDRKSVV